MLALLCAIALHYYVLSIVNPRIPRYLTVPLSAQGVPAGALFDPNSAPSISITFNGPSDAVDRLSEANVLAYADLNSCKIGDNPDVRVHVRINAPQSGDIAVAEILPASVPIVLQPVIRRTLPIAAAEPGTPPAGYAYRTPIITPPAADLVGDKVSVESVSQLLVKTDSPSSVGTVDSDFPIVPLDANGQQISNITVVPAMASVRIGIVRVPAMKVLVVSPTIVHSPPFPYKIASVLVKPESVVVSGRPNRLNQVGTISTAPVDVGGAVSDVQRQVALTAPAGTTLTDSTPVTVTVHIVTEQPDVSPPLNHVEVPALRHQ